MSLTSTLSNAIATSRAFYSLIKQLRSSGQTYAHVCSDPTCLPTVFWMFIDYRGTYPVNREVKLVHLRQIWHKCAWLHSATDVNHTEFSCLDSNPGAVRPTIEWPCTGRAVRRLWMSAGDRRLLAIPAECVHGSSLGQLVPTEPSLQAELTDPPADQIASNGVNHLPSKRHTNHSELQSPVCLQRRARRVSCLVAGHADE